MIDRNECQHVNACPTCDVLRFAGPADEPEYTGPCAACVALERAPQGESVRLFEPAPTQLPGQLNLAGSYNALHGLPHEPGDDFYGLT